MDELEREGELTQIRSTLRLIRLSGDSIRELESLANTNDVSLSILIRETLETRLLQTTKYTQGEYYASR